MNPLSTQIAEQLDGNPGLMPAQIAAELNCSEFDVVANLPAPMVALLPRDQLDPLLAELPQWGNTTTIISVAGCIFEFKGAFPRGKYGHGYYNLITKGDGLHGHLKLDVVTDIALVSKPFMGSESHSIQMFDGNGAIVFKIYLGRDRKRVLIPEQVARFTELKAEHSSQAA
ncbi:heme utilization cystosolic carrier protein HutX [uncultured Ferrimonas sp.]|uniref:heme utilization cystosolic carrier protein HutX n=1 Tax=uncultured Ferrimonas sp. TaxID=432640 RepID=UPI002614C898|nr:heme utilization cystosolic carrier protein HutX [uncultured Ferrimonas sp.]